MRKRDIHDNKELSLREKETIATLAATRLRHDIERIKDKRCYENLRVRCEEQQAEILRLRALTKHHTDVPETEEKSEAGGSCKIMFFSPNADMRGSNTGHPEEPPLAAES